MVENRRVDNSEEAARPSERNRDKLHTPVKVSELNSNGWNTESLTGRVDCSCRNGAKRWVSLGIRSRLDVWYGMVWYYSFPIVQYRVERE